MSNATTRVLPGQPYPLGATWDGRGVNFAIFSENAERIDLCLFDESGERIRFWGYDRTIEVCFFLECEALKRLSPNMGASETGYLEAFDQACSRIHEVADEIYVRGGGGKGAYAYVLSAADF